MIKRYTYQEIKEMWELRLGLSQMRTDSAIGRVDGYNVDEWLQQEIKHWYLKLLDTAPIELIPVESMKEEAEITGIAGGVVEVRLPPRCRRVVRVRLKEWETGVKPQKEGDDERREGLQQSVLTRGGRKHPVAISSGRVLRLYTTRESVPEIVELEGVTEPAEGIIVLDESLIWGDK